MNKLMIRITCGEKIKTVRNVTTRPPYGNYLFVDDGKDDLGDIGIYPEDILKYGLKIEPILIS